MPSSRALLLALLALLALVTAPAHAQGDDELSRSVSVGRTNFGLLRHAVELEPTQHLRIKETSLEARWGTAELVRMLRVAAVRVASQHPGAVLSVGDMSRPGGGRLHPHRSHRAGRDVDVGFYLTDLDGEPTTSEHFVNIDGRGNGTGRRGEGYRFDDARNWALMVALLTDPAVEIQYILVTPHIRARLLDYARDQNADTELVERFLIVTARARGSAGHHNHFHVRIYCAENDRPRCIDMPPYHAWYPGGEEAIARNQENRRVGNVVQAERRRRAAEIRQREREARVAAREARLAERRQQLADAREAAQARREEQRAERERLLAERRAEAEERRQARRERAAAN